MVRTENRVKLAATKPRLRFDKVAVGLIRRLDDALRDAIADGETVIVTVTAPVRLASKTGASLEEKIAALLAQRKRVDFKATMHGNHVSVRIVTSGTASKKLIGYVHNPDPGADDVLLDETEAQIHIGNAPVQGRSRVASVSGSSQKTR